MSRGKNTPVNMRRGNKPLAWYIGEKMLDKGDTDRETPSPSGRANSVNRKSSMESQASIKQPILPSSFPTDLIEEKKKRGNNKKNPRQRTKRLSANFSFTSAQDQPGIVRDLNQSSDKSQSASTKEKKEDYWYYDPVSDGFYYEHNGSRGWRRRNPKVHGFPVPFKPDESEAKMLMTTALAAATNTNPVNKMVVNPAVNPGAPSMKYDPNSDGYFYEMASVDGWKRRQPVSGTSPPTSSSLRDQRQQIPPAFQLLPSFLQPSLMNNSQRLVMPSMPPQNSNSTTPQAFSHAELEEMVMRMRSDPTIDNGYCGSLMDGSNSGGNLNSESMLNKSRLNALSDEFPSNASTTSSISDDMVTPPPPSRHSSFLRTIHRNHQRQMEHSKAMPIDQSKSPHQLDMTPQSQHTSLNVGSFDEPYEFYWSDTDKARSECSVDDNAPVSHDLLSFFNDLAIKPKQVESVPFETFRQRTGSSTMQRPTSLKITNNNDNSWSRGQNPEKENGRFNVDKFIEDLPMSSFLNENIINNLYALKTPISEQLPNNGDSPLYTPIFPRENAWKIPNASSKDANIAPMDRELTNADIGGNPFLFNDLERIWGQQWPAA